MSLKPLSRSVSIIGIGVTKFGDCDETPELKGMSLQDMGAWACAAAMEDAGVNPRQIGKLAFGMVCSPCYNSLNYSPIFGFLEWVGMKGKAGIYQNDGCATGMNIFNHAVEAVASGRYDIAICCDVDSTRHTQSPDKPSHIRYPTNEYKNLYGRDFVGANGWMDSAFARWNGSAFTQFDNTARHYIKDTGITAEQLEEAFIEYAITARHQGKLNPKAYAQTTWEEVAKQHGFDDVRAYLKSNFNPKISQYLRPSSFAMLDEGAAAIIVCASDIAGQFKQMPIEVVNTAQFDMSCLTPDIWSKLTRGAIKQLYEVTGYKPEDIEYMQSQDSDFADALIGAEAAGYLPKGEGWKYFRDGRTRFDKEKPMNTDGGWPSVGHAFAATTLAAMSECILQMRGQAGERQIPTPPKVSMMRGCGGGTSLTVTLFKTLESGTQKKFVVEAPKFKPQPFTKIFYEGLEMGKFLGMKCTECDNVEFPPFPICNKCGHIGNEWAELSGDVTVNEVYMTGAAFTTREFAPYAPLFGAEVTLAEGSEFTSLLFGVTPDTFEKIHNSVPLKGKLVVMPYIGQDFNSFAVGIYGAFPKPKGGVGFQATKEYEMMVSGHGSEIKEDSK